MRSLRLLVLMAVACCCATVPVHGMAEKPPNRFEELFDRCREDYLSLFPAETGRRERDQLAQEKSYLATLRQTRSYEVGPLKIIGLCQLAKVRLGSRFELRSFPEEIFEQGPLPLEIFEAWHKAGAAILR